MLEPIVIKQNEELVELIKCKSDEVLFVRYDPEKDSEATSELLNDIIAHCQDMDIPCLCLPKSDDQVYVELEQWDADRLRKFDAKIQELIRKKSPIILTSATHG